MNVSDTFPILDLAVKRPKIPKPRMFGSAWNGHLHFFVITPTVNHNLMAESDVKITSRHLRLNFMGYMTGLCSTGGNSSETAEGIIGKPQEKEKSVRHHFSFGAVLAFRC